MAGKKPMVSIIILNWNGIGFTRDCIRSIGENTLHSPYEIIVVDNGSKGQEVMELKKMQGEKRIDRLVLNKENQGFSGGNNQGIGAAQGDYFMLLNNDILVEKGWLSTLVKAGEESRKIGLVGPKITLHHTPDVCFGAGSIDDSGAARFGYETKRQEVEQIGGAALMFKRSVFRRIGGLDTGFNPIYFEESDFCERAWKAGFKVLFVPESRVVHFENAAMEKQSSRHRFVTLNKNRLRYMLIHFPVARLLKAIPFELLRVGKSIVKMRLHWLLASYWVNLRNLGEIMDKRLRYKKGRLKP